MIYPIGFAIPASKIVDSVPPKTQKISSLIPGVLSTYVYESEESYREEYKKSVFAITCKKAGWDCMRHYEILACGALPLFLELAKIPAKDMVAFPKQLVREAQEALIPFLNTDSIGDLQEKANPYIQKLLQYTREHLTTQALATYVKTVVNPNAKNILFLSNEFEVDYMRCELLHGLKELFGSACVDWPRVDHLYKDYPKGLVPKLYGKGMHISRLLDSSYDCDTSEQQVLEGIREQTFDMIIYGSVHRGCPFLDLVMETYPKDKVAFICGEDIHNCDALCFHKEGYKVFLREFEKHPERNDS
jgi:hypothetical protein